MNKIILFINFIFILSLQSQNSFEVLYSTTESNRISDIIEEEDGSYLVCGFNGDIYLSQDTINAFLMRISSEGDTNLREYINADTGYIFYRIVKKEDGYLIFGTTFKYPYNRNGKITVFKLNNDLNIEWKKIYPLGNDCSSPNKIIRLPDGGFHVLTYTSYDGVYYSYLWRFNRDGDTVRTKFVGDENGGSVMIDDFTFSQDSSQLYLFGMGYGTQSVGSIATYDTNYNYQGYEWLPERNDGIMTARWITDTTILLCAQYIHYNPLYFSIGIYESDTTFSDIDLHEFYAIDTFDYPADYNSFDYKNPDSIFLCGTHNVYAEFWTHEFSWIVLRQLNRGLNARSELLFGGDAYYRALIIKATSDGGCIIGAQRYDYRVQNSEYDVYILKLAKEDIITSNELQFVAEDNTTVYPNPGSGIMNINVNDDNSDIQIFDARGRLVKKQTLMAGHNIISTVKMPSGVYYYTVIHNSVKTESGCWIKK